MHELALAESICDIVVDAARRNGASRVTAIRLEIGALSCVEPEALRFCIDAVTRGSVAEQARLEIVATPGAAWCMPCGASVPLVALGDACPRCGSYQLAVSRGDAMKVREIEVA
jgi:hydrogenase nickel incorporation protein HypA/HybF